MPDILFPNLEALPEELRASAKEVEGGGGYVINLVPNERLQEFRTNNITVSKQRDELDAIVKQVKQIFPDFEPTKVEEELKALRVTAARVKDGSLTENKAIEETLAERTKIMKGLYEEQITTKAAEAKAAAARAAFVEEKMRVQAIRQAVLTAALDPKSGVSPSAIEDIVYRANSVFKVEDDGARVTPKIGETTLYGADGTTPMTPVEWVQSLKERNPHLFQQSNGGGGNFGGGGKNFGGFTADQISKLTPEEKIALANESRRQGQA